MAVVLVATGAGCFEFDYSGKKQTEFSGKMVGGLSSETDGACLAVVDGNEIWRRDAAGNWSLFRKSAEPLVALAFLDGLVLAATTQPGLLSISKSGETRKIEGFDQVEGRSDWFQQGPPLHIRSLTVTADGSAIMAAVHVGGIPRSADRGMTWAPTVPIMDDVHEVRADKKLANVVAAATAYGLCASQDGGANWTTFSDGLEVTHGLSVAMLAGEVIFSVQEDPFAKRSQVWRWKHGERTIEQVRDGLPEWQNGKIDTCQMAAGDGRAAFVDGGGNLWLSDKGSMGWNCIAAGVPYPLGVLIV